MPKLSLHLHKMTVHDPIHEFHYSLSSQEYIPHKFRGMGVGIQAFRSGKEQISVTFSHAGWCESCTLRKMPSCCGYVTNKMVHSSVSQLLSHGRASTINFRIPRNLCQWKHLQARKSWYWGAFCYQWWEGCVAVWSEHRYSATKCTLNTNWQKKKTKRQLIVHRDYCRIANC
jgi:hypothetical protein